MKDFEKEYWNIISGHFWVVGSEATFIFLSCFVYIF